MPDYFSIMPGFFFSFFFHFLLLFVIFFITYNFCKLLFTVQRGKVSCFRGLV